MSDLENRIKMKLLDQLQREMDDSDAEKRRGGGVVAMTIQEEKAPTDKLADEKPDAVYLNPQRQKVMGEIEGEDEPERDAMRGWGSFMRTKKEKMGDN